MTLNAIIANFQTFKLVDLLDIIIISFLIYQLLGNQEGNDDDKIGRAHV